MKKALLSLTIGFGLIASMPAEASYGAAGCGLGSQVIAPEDQAGFKGLVAVIINGVFANQMISISLGLGNCADGAGSIDTYIEENATQLAFEFSQGEGENVSTLAGMLNCEEGNLVEYGQSNYESLFNDTQSLSDNLQNYAASECGI